jgi:apolipoprotein N-acyltransferase
VALLLAFPPYGLWWLAPIGVALLAIAVHRCRPRIGAALGLVFFLPLLGWTARFVDVPPWLLLAGLEAAYLGLLGAAAAYASPLVDRYRWTWPLVTAVLWVAQEALRDRTPFGGFPWGRLAFSQGDSPLLRLAGAGGAPLVTFGVALAGGLLAGGLLAAAAYRPAAYRPAADRPAVYRSALLTAAGAVVVVLAGLALPVARPAGTPVIVAVVQGNVPRLGLDFNEQRRAVLDNHVSATLALADRVAAGQQRQPDLVVWPENSSDIDPLRNPDAGARIDQAAQAIRAPILVGAVLVGPAEGAVRNVGLVWQPGSGLGAMYTKRHPVPFAEYMPWRPVLGRLARMIAAQADLLRNDFVAGGPPGVLQVGPAVVGDVICFEVAYDSVVRDTVLGGAQLLSVQTNNATFDEAEARQQLAMVRLRAVEHGRDALMASTVGISAFVTADGKVHDATEFDTRAVIVRQLHLGSGRTLATRLGAGPEAGLTVAAVGVIVAAAVLRRRRRA